MNGNVNYIVHASLLLIIATITVVFLGNLPPVFIEKSEPGWCATETPSTSTVGLSGKALQGKSLFMQNCASCHVLFKAMTGPPLHGFTSRGPWLDRQNVYDWIKNPSGFIIKNEYARELKKSYNGVMMQSFPHLANEQIDAICEYVELSRPF